MKPLKSVVHSIRKGHAHVRVDLRLVAPVDQVKETPRIIGKTAAVGKIANIADARPTCRRDVLIGRPNPARVRKTDKILDLDRETPFHDWRRNRVTGDLPHSLSSGPDR